MCGEVENEDFELGYREDKRINFQWDISLKI